MWGQVYDHLLPEAPAANSKFPGTPTVQFVEIGFGGKVLQVVRYGCSFSFQDNEGFEVANQILISRG